MLFKAPVPVVTKKNFDTIRKHRNKMVHFFHDADRTPWPWLTENIALEQLRAWHDLHELLTVDWAPIFESFDQKFDEIDKKLSGHREFLRAKFDKLAPSIKEEKSRGIQFRICPSCGFDAARVLPVLGDLFKSTCLVCRRRGSWFNYTCSNCNKVSPLGDGGEFVCTRCQHKDDQAVIVEKINEFIITSDNYMDARVPAHCAECEGYHSVVEYKEQFLCVVCFLVTEHVAACGWCSEYGNGDMGDSAMFGCTMCGGSVGNQMSKDDYEYAEIAASTDQQLFPKVSYLNWFYERRATHIPGLPFRQSTSWLLSEHHCSLYPVIHRCRSYKSSIFPKAKNIYEADDRLHIWRLRRGIDFRP